MFWETSDAADTVALLETAFVAVVVAGTTS